MGPWEAMQRISGVCFIVGQHTLKHSLHKHAIVRVSSGVCMWGCLGRAQNRHGGHVARRLCIEKRYSTELNEPNKA